MNIACINKHKKADALILLMTEKNWSIKQYGTLINKELSKEIEEKIKKAYIGGKKGESLELHTKVSGYERVFVIGYGKEIENSLRKACGTAVRLAKKIKAKNVNILLNDKQSVKKGISGVLLGHYEFKLGDIKERFAVGDVNFITEESLSSLELKEEVSLGDSANFTRDLVNMPASMMTPSILAEKAKELAKINKDVKIKILGEKEIKKLKMGNLYKVGRGSDEESKVIILEYMGGKKEKAPKVFIGKGVTFDSGGYNIKPTGHMETMKQDMAGGATVLGLFKWIAETSPKENVVGIIGAVENMVSGNAYKPGDITTGMNGQTIEITNTDAEGRLVMSDCLYYGATIYKPSEMYDIATLTGAVTVALGYSITGVVGNDSKLMKKVVVASKKEEESVWELPLTDEFREKTKGSISDLVNWTKGASAGSSMAAAFLDNFVEKTPWVHFDVAGTAFDEKSGDELSPAGATGAMLRTFAELVRV